MKYFSLLLIVLSLFIVSCNSDNTTTTTWDGCIKDANCETGQNCVAGNCIETNECTDDTSCLNGQFCNEAKLCETFCETNDDCGVGFICNSESKKCEKDDTVKLCENDADCVEGEICSNYECIEDTKPDTCETDADCLNGEVCKDAKCVKDAKTCESDLDCFNGEHCSDGICLTDCTETSCQEGYKCNLDTKNCEEDRCSSDRDCSNGYFCDSGVCKTKEYECTDNSQCFQGYECKDNKCEAINQNECNVASDCSGIPEIDCMGAHWECENHECIAACGEDKCGNYVCDEDLGEDFRNCPIDCRDDHCDDGTEPMCDMMPPNCVDGQILAYINNCYECVNTVTCTNDKPECVLNRDCREYGDNLMCQDGVCVERVEPICGNGVCEIGERNTCPEDCQEPTCGDGICSDGELYTCPQDCNVEPQCFENMDCADYSWDVRCVGHWSCENNQCVEQCDFDTCGDDYCDRELGETETTCPMDCNSQVECRSDYDCTDSEYCAPNGLCEPLDQPVCGDGNCDIGEWDSCPIDCQTDCRTDADCAADEYCTSDGFCKPSDQSFCGDGVCDPDIGEDVNSCPADCSTEPAFCIPGLIECPAGYECIENQCLQAEEPICGDGYCDEANGENVDTCEADCININPVCEDDNLEANNSMTDAYTIEIGQNYSNLSITYEDKDWYSFYYDGQSRFSIKVSFTNNNGDIDIYTYQNRGQIAVSEGYTDSETLVINPREYGEGNVYLNVALIQNPNDPDYQCQHYNMEIVEEQ